MPLQSRFRAVAILLSITLGAVVSYHDHSNIHNKRRQVTGYRRDWDTDWKQWAQQQGWQLGDPVPDYDYTKTLSTRRAPSALPQELVAPTTRQLASSRQELEMVRSTYQKGSAIIPYPGAAVRVTPNKVHTQLTHKSKITAKVTDGLKKKNRHHIRHGETVRSGDTAHSPQPPCVRCPEDRAVLATKGSSTVLMETPPVIPCNHRSPVSKVKVEVVAGPQPGSELDEGSHKMAVRYFHRKRDLASCTLRYNVIVRKCPPLKLEQEVEADCSQETVWGSYCTFSCGPGYILQGESRAECDDNLEWTSVSPNCIQDTECQAPAAPENGYLSCKTPHHRPLTVQGGTLLPDGTVCHFQCQGGYQTPPEQLNLTRIRCIAGTWDSDQDPVCDEIKDLVVEDELPPDLTAEDAIKMDGEGCPVDYCLRRGHCVTNYGEHMCSCLPGYTGPQCEGTDENNTIEGTIQ